MEKNPSSGWRRYALWIFVLLAYAITWAIWLPVDKFARERGYVMPDPQTLQTLLRDGFQDGTHILLSATYTVISGPLFAAIIVLAFESGRKGLRLLWQRCTHWRVGWRWYLVILAIVAGIFLPSAVYGLVKGPLPSGSQAWMPLTWLVPVFVFEFLSSGLEEPGWRGYALPKLQTRFKAKTASLILGVIWGIWHWPVFIPVYMKVLSAPGGSPAGAFFTALIQLLLYILGAMIPEALIYTWLYNRTRSVFLCILFHIFHNMVVTYVGTLLPSAASIIPTLGVVSTWLIAIILMRFFWVEAPHEEQKGELK